MRHGLMQSAIIPLSLLCTLAAAYPAWNQHDVRETSPVFPTEAAVRAWGQRTATARRCLAISIDLRVTSQADVREDKANGPWFATLRCNQPRVAWRMIAILVVPWAAMTLLVFLLNLTHDRREKKR